MASPDSITFAAADVAVYLAAAGSGKTTALMNEMTELLKTYRPDEIAFVTYTRKGVANGVERALRANPQLSADSLTHFKTLHALCFRELGLERASIITWKKLRKLNRLFGYRLTLHGTFEFQTDDDKLITRYDAERNGSVRGLTMPGQYNAGWYNRLVRDYEAFKRAEGLVDFHDCLLRFRDRGLPVAVKVAFIDEAQDLTPLQWEVCQTAFSACEKIRIAGDDFQSVFTYSGASPRTLISLARRYRAVKLETSYRLPGAVYRLAREITGFIGEKADKDFRPADTFEGFVKELYDRDMFVRRIRGDLERNGLAPYRWYLLFRNNCFVGEITGLLEKYVIPYHTARGFCIPERDLMKLRRFFNYRKQGFGDKEAFNKFCEEHGIKDIRAGFTESDLIPSERRYVYQDYVDEFGIDSLSRMADKEPFVLLSTTHRVKGGEADYAAVFLDCTRSVAMNAQRNADDELRVLYVACTRARMGLYLVPGRSGHNLSGIMDLVKERTA